VTNGSAAKEEGGDIRSRIVEAATILFSQQGFARTSTSQIVALARTSKRAIYVNFADKHAILEAVLDQFITRRFAVVEQLSRGSSDARTALESMLQGLVQASTDDVTMTMYRVLIAERDHFPDLSERASELGVEQAMQLLSRPLFELGITDPEIAAKLLYDICVLAPLHRRMVGAKDQPVPVTVIVEGILSGFARHS